MTRISIVAALLFFLVSCSMVHRTSRERDTAIPITFEAYPWRGEASPPSGVYDLHTIHILLEADCLFREPFDASKGIPVSLVRERSYRYAKGKTRIPRHGYLKKTKWFSAIIMPEFYQRVGGLELYLVRFDSDGNVNQVIPEKSGGGLPDRNLFRLCKPGDKIVAEWYF